MSENPVLQFPQLSDALALPRSVDCRELSFRCFASRVKEKYIPRLKMGGTNRDLTNSDKTHFNKTSFPCGNEDERAGLQRLTPFVIRKLWVGEERKEVEVEVEEEADEEDVNMPLTSTSKFHQVGLMVRGVLCLTVFFSPRSG